MIKLPFLLLPMAIFIFCCIYWRSTFEFFEIFLEFTQDHPLLGSLVIFAIYALLPIVCILVYLVAIGAGYIYYEALGAVGLCLCCIITWIGTMLGALLSFLVARYLIKGTVYLCFTPCYFGLFYSITIRIVMDAQNVRSD